MLSAQVKIYTTNGTQKHSSQLSLDFYEHDWKKCYIYGKIFSSFPFRGTMSFPFYVNKTVDVRKNITLENAKIGYQENSRALLEWKWSQRAVNLSGIRFNVSD